MNPIRQARSADRRVCGPRPFADEGNSVLPCGACQGRDADHRSDGPRYSLACCFTRNRGKTAESQDPRLCATRFGDATIGGGFVRPREGRFVEFNPPDSNGTYVSAISPVGVIVGGFFINTDVYGFADSYGFVRDPDGNFTIYDSTGTSALPTNFDPAPMGINSSGEIAGTYDYDYFYVRFRDGNLVTLPAPTSNSALFPEGINEEGTVAGGMDTFPFAFQGFVQRTSEYGACQ